MLAAMHVLAALGETTAGTKLSEVLKPYIRYVASGEINTKVSDSKVVVNQINDAFASRALETDTLDGLTVSLNSGWFNVRASNTEPLLRLNVEASTKADMVGIRDEVLAIMKASK
jgi:phosphomannomutase